MVPVVCINAYVGTFHRGGDKHFQRKAQVFADFCCLWADVVQSIQSKSIFEL